LSQLISRTFPNKILAMGGETKKRGLGVAEASSYLGISKIGLYRMAERREIASCKIKKRLIFLIEDLDMYLQANRREAVNPSTRKP